ncbi:galacturonan 1,4-alpha-galacturonidase [Ranunculus cassubicifolius]
MTLRMNSVFLYSSLLIFLLKFALLNATVAPAPEPGSTNATSKGNSSSTTSGNSTGGLFDVTKYGAVADGKTDAKTAFECAWKEACNYAGDATFLVPEGEFFLGPVSFCGPCHNSKSPKVEIKGTLKAPTDLTVFKEPTWLEFRDLCALNVSGFSTGVLDGQGESTYTHGGCHTSGAACKNYPCSLRVIKVKGGVISDLGVLNSKGFHISVLQSDNLLFRDMKITAPGNSPNTDGIHISESSSISLTNSKIGVGDDCVSIGHGNNNICITNVDCGPGHGISVGSLGKFPDEKDVNGVHVKNCTLTGTDNGVRIKTWPGSPPLRAYNFTFEDITVNGVKNPIIIDQEYCPGNKCISKPSQVKITGVSFKNIKGTSSTKCGVTLACSQSVVCEDVKLSDIDIKDQSQGPTTATCTNVQGLSITGMTNPPPCTPGAAAPGAAAVATPNAAAPGAAAVATTGAAAVAAS